MLASLRREGDVQRIDLVGLDDLEVIEMMEAAAGHEMPEDRVALAHAVRQETEGNPFFTAEMLMHLGESGLVRQAITHDPDRAYYAITRMTSIADFLLRDFASRGFSTAEALQAWGRQLVQLGMERDE